MDYIIPKLEMPVEMAMADMAEGGTEAYTFFLNQFSANHTGREDVGEFLNSHQLFIPVRRKENGRFFIVNADQIYYVMEKERAVYETHVRLELQFKNGMKLQVDHCEPLPAGHTRPVDFFNGKENFLRLGYFGHPIHVNKSNVARVSVIE